MNLEALEWMPWCTLASNLEKLARCRFSYLVIQPLVDTQKLHLAPPLQLNLKFQFMVNGQHLDLVHGSQGGINVSPCWSHPCSVQNATVSSPCGLQGTCKPIMNDYSCECPLGLTGARCEHILSGTSLVATETSRQTTRSSLLDNAPAFIGDSFLHYNDQPIAQK